MSAVPMPTPTHSQGQLETYIHDHTDWLHIGSGVTLIAGALLLLAGQKKIGLIVTAAGATLSGLEHRELVSEWWEKLPKHLEKAEHMITQAQETIENITQKRDQVMNLFGK